MNDTDTATTTPTLSDWVNAGWTDHAEDAEGVMQRFDQGIELVSDASHLPQLAGLIVHVSANHLGRHADGLALLDRLARLPVYDAAEPAGQAILRCQAILQLCAGDEDTSRALEDQAHAGSDLPRASTSVRVQGSAAAALAERGDLARGTSLFRSALDLASYGPDKDDPAARSLATTANNLACGLEEKEGRSAAEDELLELASKTARAFWEIAGTWTQVKIAEYRLAMTYLALGNAEQATLHAKQSLALCDANDGSQADRFFPYEALARARHAAADPVGAKTARNNAAEVLPEVDAAMRAWCSAALAKLDLILG